MGKGSTTPKMARRKRQTKKKTRVKRQVDGSKKSKR